MRQRGDSNPNSTSSLVGYSLKHRHAPALGDFAVATKSLEPSAASLFCRGLDDVSPSSGNRSKLLRELQLTLILKIFCPHLIQKDSVLRVSKCSHE